MLPSLPLHRRQSNIILYRHRTHNFYDGRPPSFYPGEFEELPRVIQPINAEMAAVVVPGKSGEGSVCRGFGGGECACFARVVRFQFDPLESVVLVLQWADKSERWVHPETYQCPKILYPNNALSVLIVRPDRRRVRGHRHDRLNSSLQGWNLQSPWLAFRLSSKSYCYRRSSTLG